MTEKEGNGLLARHDHYPELGGRRCDPIGNGLWVRERFITYAPIVAGECAPFAVRQLHRQSGNFAISSDPSHLAEARRVNLHISHAWPPEGGRPFAPRLVYLRNGIVRGVDGRKYYIYVSSIYIEDVRSVRRTTNWRAKLPIREALITALSVTPSPKTMFFKSPLCIGFSEKHAAEVIYAILDQQTLVFVQSQRALYRSGDGLSELIEAVGRHTKAARQRRYRAHKPG